MPSREAGEVSDNEASWGLQMKQEPTETRDSLILPELDRRQHEPPDEILSLPDSTPFPRALHRPDPLADLSPRESTESGELAETSEDTEHHTTPAPSEQQSREERLKRVFLGHLGLVPGNNIPRRRERDSTMRFPNQDPPPRDVPWRDNNAYSAANPRMQLPARDPFTSPSPSYRPNPGSQCGILPTQLLSEACQARRFNPQFITTETAGGLFACDVKLLQAIVKGDRLYPSEEQAKYAVANKALNVIRSWPPASDHYPPDYRPRREDSWLDRAHKALTQRPVNTEHRMAMADDWAFRPAHRDRDRDIDRMAEQARLIDHVSNTIPESSLMFLEGLVAGARAAQLFATPRRGRSLSPPLHRHSVDYHERSPSPRHNQSSPSRSNTYQTGGRREMEERPRGMLRYTDRYRPRDSYVPEYARGGQEDTEWPHDRYCG
ncbi:hypothetical protein NEMBOFW57_003547 [Staphylotrichum longicolle]|uniref:Uncharacterized protein n=1 Tax=Staphylotrichum longicolle TaxID=669026 RepID=A0AAD4F6E6_9PEZI|nr:hypothetical protein NEMBOFW57_003547 [Staphylotrichum longicolle]